ncbi:MAG: hypothetical protein RR204_00560 [Raoultibacter sp.]
MSAKLVLNSLPRKLLVQWASTPLNTTLRRGPKQAQRRALPASCFARKMFLIFDNGRSLFFDLGFSQSGDFSQESRFKLPSWSQVTFEEQAARFIGPVQQAQLEKLQSFEFVNSAKFAFPTPYLKDLSCFIQKRAEQLFSFPAQSREALRETAQATRNKNSPHI